jgi:hypothetical protein
MDNVRYSRLGSTGAQPVEHSANLAALLFLASAGWFCHRFPIECEACEITDVLGEQDAIEIIDRMFERPGEQARCFADALRTPIKTLVVDGDPVRACHRIVPPRRLKQAIQDGFFQRADRGALLAGLLGCILTRLHCGEDGSRTPVLGMVLPSEQMLGHVLGAGDTNRFDGRSPLAAVGPACDDSPPAVACDLPSFQVRIVLPPTVFEVHCISHALRYASRRAAHHQDAAHRPSP